MNEKSLHLDSDDEVKDVVGETRFIKRIKSVRSSSLLHSVEDLSTDSTCVYKARSGFDSNRSSRRRNGRNTFSTDEILVKIPVTSRQTTMQIAANRGLSKSMVIPTPISDISEMEDGEEKKRHKATCCDKIKRSIKAKKNCYHKFCARIHISYQNESSLLTFQFQNSSAKTLHRISFQKAA